MSLYSEKVGRSRGGTSKNFCPKKQRCRRRKILPVSLAGTRQQTAFLKARKKFAEPGRTFSGAGQRKRGFYWLVSGVEARPAKDLAVVQSFTAANFGLVCLPTAVAGFTSGFPSERFAAGNIKMGMVPLPALALAAGSFPGLFDHAIRKGHLTPPIPCPGAVGTDSR